MRIIFTQRARRQLIAIHEYIEDAASLDVARKFTGGIIERLSILIDFPHTGTPRDDVYPGLRTISYRRRVTIAFFVEKAEIVVTGLSYGGQDFETLLREAPR